VQYITIGLPEGLTEALACSGGEFSCAVCGQLTPKFSSNTCLTKGVCYAQKIDPLNKKLYGSVTAMLTVTDVKAAADFYQKAFGFAKRGIMNGPDGKAIHAELTLRGTTLMLGPEMAQMGSRSAKTIGASPTSLYLLTEKVDKTVAKAVKLGAVLKGPVMDMFWGDRCGAIVDPRVIFGWSLPTWQNSHLRKCNGR